MSDRRRVVVTGMGWVTGLGCTVGSAWREMLAGASGIREITRFDTADYAVKFGGEVCQWKPHNLEPRQAKRLDRFAQFALDAAIDAVHDAGLDFEQENPWRCGAVIGTGIGGLEEFESGYRKLLEKGPDRLSPFVIPKLMCNAGSGNVSIYFGLKGPNSATTTACASGAHALAEASDLIRDQEADVMIAGGSEAALTPLGLASFTALKALSKRNEEPPRASRPFDADRDGFVLAEGAGLLVLEDYEHALARGANIYAEFLGAGQSADGTHITAPDEQGEGAAYAMAQAMRAAGIGHDQIDYINAHGTSTPLGDLAETRAVKRLFRGEGRTGPPVSSTKSMTGHTLGASGGIEAIITTKAIETGMLPPTINLDQPGEECDLDYVPRHAREAEVRYAMSNSFGFGGHNVSLILGRV